MKNLFYLKDLAAVKQLVNSLNLGGCNCIVNLLLQLGFVSCIVNATDNADCQRVSHLSKQVVDARILGCHVVNQDVLFGNAVFTNGNNLEVGTVEYKTLVAFLTENHRLTVFEHYYIVVANILTNNAFVNLIVEDNAVLQ